MTFWDVFFILLIWIPLVLLWASALFDIFRRDDIGGVHKAIWVVVVLFLPLIGVITYLILRRPGATPQEREIMEEVSQEDSASQADQLKTLAKLHDAGKLSDQEFAQVKANIIGS